MDWAAAIRDNLDASEICDAFIKGAASALAKDGVRGSDLADKTASVVKEARKKPSWLFNGRGVSDEGDEPSWWDDNKWYVLAPLLALGAFKLGGTIQANGRPDRGPFENIGVAADKLAKRLAGPFDAMNPSTWSAYK